MFIEILGHIPVEVGTDAVEYPSTELILLPLLRVELQYGLVDQVIALRDKGSIHVLVLTKKKAWLAPCLNEIRAFSAFFPSVKQG